MMRKSALVLGVVFSAWFVLDVVATNAEACGGCRRRSCCQSSCYSSCGSCCNTGGCGGGYYASSGYYGGGYYGSSGYYGRGYYGNAGYYGRGYYGNAGYYGGGGDYGSPAYGGSSCSSCSAGVAVPGAYGYAVRVAPGYGSSNLLTLTGGPSTT